MKTRIIHTKFWKDTFVSDLNPSEKLIFLYLLTNDRVNIIHCYECADREILFDTGVTKDALESAKAKLSDSGKAHFFQDYVFLSNAGKYDQYRGELSDKGRQTQEREMCPEVFSWYKANLEGGLKPPCDTLEGDQKGTINNKQEIINNNTETIRSKKIEEKKIEASVTYLDDVPDSDAQALAEKFDVSIEQVTDKAEELADYCRSKGKTYKDYHSFLRNCLKKDIRDGKIKTGTVTPPPRPDDLPPSTFDAVYDAYLAKQELYAENGVVWDTLKGGYVGKNH